MRLTNTGKGAFYECRVLGVLLEKEVTTPEQYPMSLNALTNACNQKSNRHPVLQLEESTVSQTLEALDARRLVSRVSGSRVEKYRHRFCNTEFGDLQLSPQQVAIIADESVEDDPALLKAENARLQKEVERLNEEIASLRQKLLDAGIPV